MFMRCRRSNIEHIHHSIVWTLNIDSYIPIAQIILGIGEFVRYKHNNHAYNYKIIILKVYG